MDNNNFGLNISDLSSADYDVNVEEQKPNRLNFVAVKVFYRKSIAGKKIQLNYDNNRTRRLYSVDQSIPDHILFLEPRLNPTPVAEYHNNNRQLLAVSFDITVSSFPPA